MEFFMPYTLIDEEWTRLKELLPDGWEQGAIEFKAMRRGRGVPNPEALLRLIFLHVAAGLSLRQACARAAVLGLASISDVALLKRLRAAEEWLREMCVAMTRRKLEDVVSLPARFRDRRLRIVDATTVQEPGAKGTSWRMHSPCAFPR
jgi:hypothetical protein